MKKNTGVYKELDQQSIYIDDIIFWTHTLGLASAAVVAEVVGASSSLWKVNLSMVEFKHAKLAILIPESLDVLCRIRLLLFNLGNSVKRNGPFPSGDTTHPIPARAAPTLCRPGLKLRRMLSILPKSGIYEVVNSPSSVTTKTKPAPNGAAAPATH